MALPRVCAAVFCQQRYFAPCPASAVPVSIDSCAHLLWLYAHVLSVRVRATRPLQANLRQPAFQDGVN